MTRRLRTAALVAAVAVASLGALSTPAHGAKGMEVALQDDSALLAQNGMSRGRALKLADQLHVTRIRVNVLWSSVVKKANRRKRPKHPRYDFTSYDRLVNAARAHGMKLELTLSGFAPAWATGNHRIGGYKPNVKYFKEFVRVTAKHFKGHVDRYAIWNEPNYVSWISPLKSGPKIYRSLYVAGWSTIKSIDPAAKVLIGETAPYEQARRCTAPLKFLRGVLQAGPLKADGYAHHPYDFRHSLTYRYPGKDNATLYTLGNLTSLLDRYAGSRRLATPAGKSLPLYLTEYGFMGSGKYKIKDSKRAKYLTKAFQYALDNSHVKQMLQYLIVKPSSAHAFFDTSIVSRKGKKSKSFKALASWTKKQANAKRIAKPIPPAPDYHPPR
jgi:hypothetical protein